MHVEFCAKLNFLEGEYAIMQNIGFLLSWVGNPCRYLVLRPCKKGPDFVEALLAPPRARGATRGAHREGNRVMEFSTVNVVYCIYEEDFLQ